MTKSEILETVARENVRFVKLFFTDVFGELKNVEITAAEIGRALANEIFIDGSSIRGLTQTQNSDVVLSPDADSFRLLPCLGTARFSVGALFCDILNADLTPNDGCVRSNLKRVLGKARALGFSEFNVGFEPEFYLFQSPTKPAPASPLKHDLLDAAQHQGRLAFSQNQGSQTFHKGKWPFRVSKRCPLDAGNRPSENALLDAGKRLSENDLLASGNRPSENDLLDAGGYCAIDTQDAAAALRREISFELDLAGLATSTSHHEVGSSQSEITFAYAGAIRSCDNALLERFLVQMLAARAGFVADFSPKPIKNLAGNGLHTNISLVFDGKNAFWDFGVNTLSKTAHAFITGVLGHARGLCFLTNPSENSYQRLVKHFEAPVNVCWSYANRSAMIRVPRAVRSAARAEIRNVDSSANPYLAVSGILASGLSGIESNAPLIEAEDANIFDLTDAEKVKRNLTALPESLLEARSEFLKDEVLRSAVSERIASFLVSR